MTSLIKNRSELSTSRHQINVHKKRSSRSSVAFHVNLPETSGREDPLAKSQCRLGTYPGRGRQLPLLVQTGVLVVTRRSDNKRTNKGVAGERPTGSKKSRRPSGRPPSYHERRRAIGQRAAVRTWEPSLSDKARCCQSSASVFFIFLLFSPLLSYFIVVTAGRLSRPLPLYIL